jgi:cold shock protein
MQKRGVVKWYNKVINYGFIIPDDGGVDVFVHRSGLAKARLNWLEPGQRVCVELVNNTRTGRIVAANVRLYREDEAPASGSWSPHPTAAPKDERYA